MLKYLKTEKPSPTDLTWEEQNPSSYLFNVEALTNLQKAFEEFREELTSNEGRKQKESHTPEK